MKAALVALIGICLVIVAVVLHTLRHQIHSVLTWLNPSVMDLINLALALVGIALSVPSALQMFCGRPKIRIGFGKSDLPDATILKGEIFNIPRYKGILFRIGVRTAQADDVWATYVIREGATGKDIYEPQQMPLIGTYGQKSQRAVLPASAMPGVFFIAKVDKKLGKVLAGEEDEFELAPGSYRAEVKVSVGMETYKKSAILKVTASYPYGFWSS